eukprot:6491032-Amphidinium_carterae.2
MRRQVTKLGNSYIPENPSLSTTVLIGEVEDISQQACIPRQLRQPPQPTKKEQDEHRSTHTSTLQVVVSNMREGQRTTSTSSTRRSQRTIGDTARLRLRKVQFAHSKEVASSHNLDLRRDNDRTLYGNPYISQRCDKASVDTIEEIRDGERLQSLNHPGRQRAGNHTILARLLDANWEYLIDMPQLTHIRDKVRSIKFDLVDRCNIKTVYDTPQTLSPWILQHACFTIN